jgi:hypothetical protein
MSDPIASDVLRHARVLAEQIGPRMAGTSANRTAADYIAGVFARTGLAVETLPFACPGWHCTETVLELDGTPLVAAANVTSPSCDLSAPTVAAETVAELDAADIAGKIAVLYGDLTREPLIPLNCPIYNTERDQHINRTLLDGRPASVITVNPHLHSVERRIVDPDFTIPSVTVPADVGARLLHRLGAPLHLRIVAERQPSSGAHVLGLKPGPRPARIVLMAHFDTQVDSPGAWDNAGGVAALLVLAERLASRDLACGLEFIAFPDEETYSNDHVVYIRERGDQFGDILAAINLDGIAHILGHNTITAMAHSLVLQETLTAITARYPRVQWVEPWPQSNHSTFAWHGVPAIALSASVPWSGIAHQPTDTPLWLSPDLLAEAVSLVEAIVAAIHDRPLDWSRPEPGGAGE